jgi:glucose-6-phosphate 1-dehydrogenase
LWIFAILKFKMSDGEKLPPTILVIFGITGDLSHRYLLPALYQLCRSGQLLKDFKIVGVSRREIIVDGLYNKGEESLKQYTVPFQMDLESPESYQSLKAKISEIKNNFSSEPEVIYYLSVPPAGVLQIIRHLGESGLNSKNSKLLLEKPFGVDLESASNLIDETQKYFPQEQVYRIDHYLVKETA